MEENATPNPPASKRTRPGARAFWRSPAGKARKAEYKAKYTGRSNPKLLGRTGPGRIAPGAAVLDWQIARALTSGQSSGEAAKTLGMKRRTVESRSAEIGLAHGSVFLCDQGTVFREKSLTAIREASGFLTREKFETFAGLPLRSCDARDPEGIRVPEIARAMIAWRDRAIKELIAAPADKGRPYKNAEVLNTFLPALDGLKDCLAETFAQIKAELREYPEWRIANVWDFTAKQSRENQNERAWYRTLCYLWEIETILASKLTELREANYGKDKKGIAGFVCKILAERYGTTHHTIIRAMRKGDKPTRTIPPSQMLGLLLSSLPSATIAIPQGQPPAARLKSRGVRTPRKGVEQTRKYQMARAAYDAEPEMTRGIALLRASKKANGPHQTAHSGILTRAGFNAKQINALLDADNAIGAAQRYVALLFAGSKHPHGLKLKTVQDACSLHRKHMPPR